MPEERTWKPPQLTAIGAREKTVLVSASAGTGKTTVLTERLISRITDAEAPADVSRLLVVTFTKAAAAELKDRITAALNEKIAEEPDNKRLTRQWLALSHAHISTIHSFCLDLIRSHFSELGLEPDFRVADEEEAVLLKNLVMRSVLEDYYEDAEEIAEDEKIPDFAAFLDRFVSVKDEEFTAPVISLYDRLRGLPEGIGAVTDAAEEYGKAQFADFFSTPWGKAVFTNVKNTVTSLYSSAESLVSEALRLPKEIGAKLLPAFEDDADRFGAMLAALDGDYDTARDAVLDGKWKSCGRFTGGMPEEAEALKNRRESLKKRYKDLTERYFPYTGEEIKKTAADFASLCAALGRFLLRYERVLTAEKKKRGILDFGDLERYAHALLRKDGVPTDTAHAVAAQFDEICIDEYQDVNELQDSVFSAIAESGTRFMVGDIKQSIYAFRGATPGLFADYRKDQNVRTIFLQHNFRCSPAIIDFVNRVFHTVFASAPACVPYAPGDDLIPGKEHTEEGPAPEIVLYAGKEDRINMMTAEAEAVADRIAELIEKEHRKPKDIVILLRSIQPAVFFENALNRRRIPVLSQLSHDFFENPEILLMLCLLNVIDNPSKDVYLSGLMRSPLFGFTLDEMLRIRSEAKNGSLYDSLREYMAVHPDFAKGRRFLDKVVEYRAASVSLPVDKLIWKLYTDTDILSLIYSGENPSDTDVAVRRSNLMLLYENARKFESGAFRGLYQFIRYLEEMLGSDGKDRPESAQAFGEDAEPVRIMTIHKSKGLEFPVVFLCRAASGFSNADSSSLFSYAKDTGLSFYPSDENGILRADTPFRQGVLASQHAERIAEEMRILYVALTRAKERLIVTGTVRDNKQLSEAEAIPAFVSSLGEKDIDAYLTDSPSYIKWILTAIGREKTNAVLRTVPLPEEESERNEEEGLQFFSAPRKEIDPPATEPETADEEIVRLIRERFAFVYPYEEATKIPAKFSVSGLKPDILDEDEEKGATPEDVFPTRPKEPVFLRSYPGKEKASAAERGTATHVFMQFCDFENTEKNGIGAEIGRLIEKQFLPSSYAELIDTDAVSRFFASRLFREMKNASDLRREVRFNVRLPAAQFTEEREKKAQLAEDTILVQGVIDCFFRSPDGTVTLIDYKTDRLPDDEEKAEALIRERHSLQLSYYRKALENLLCTKVDRVLIYAFSNGRTVTIDV